MKVVVVLFLIFPFSCFSQITGRVISVTDGDTFTMIESNKQVKVRLHGIDCPEKGQDFYFVAKQSLSDMVFGKFVTVKRISIDKYKRIVGIVWIDEINVNERMLRSGLAWHYKKYDTNPEWKKFEQQAKLSKCGVWSMSNPIAPWEFRKRKKSKSY